MPLYSEHVIVADLLPLLASVDELKAVIYDLRLSRKKDLSGLTALLSKDHLCSIS